MGSCSTVYIRYLVWNGNDRHHMKDRAPTQEFLEITTRNRISPQRILSYHRYIHGQSPCIDKIQVPCAARLVPQITYWAFKNLHSMVISWAMTYLHHYSRYAWHHLNLDILQHYETSRSCKDRSWIQQARLFRWKSVKMEFEATVPFGLLPSVHDRCSAYALRRIETYLFRIENHQRKQPILLPKNIDKEEGTRIW